MPYAPRIQITQRKLLIVEGKDEESLFSAALNRHLAITSVQVLPIGGKTNLHANLRALMNDPGFGTVQTLAIVRDADVAPPGSPVGAAAAAFNTVSGVLTSLRLPVPRGHGGYAVGPPKVGVFIMPDGVSEGMLETLCVTAAQGQPGFACLDVFFRCLQGDGVVPLNMHKARAHAWLSSRPEPDMRVGEAALKDYWVFGDPAFDALWDFVRVM